MLHCVGPQLVQDERQRRTSFIIQSKRSAFQVNPIAVNWREGSKLGFDDMSDAVLRQTVAKFPAMGARQRFDTPAYIDDERVD